jgi:hypothetical protein
MRKYFLNHPGIGPPAWQVGILKLLQLCLILFKRFTTFPIICEKFQFGGNPRTNKAVFLKDERKTERVN